MTRCTGCSIPVLIGLHPGATQIILPRPRACVCKAPARQKHCRFETPKGGSNVVIGIGLYTRGNNLSARSRRFGKPAPILLMNDVRFLGGHGTPLPGGCAKILTTPTTPADPAPDRHWDSQYPSLWVTDGGGGAFPPIFRTPSTRFAQLARNAGILDTETPEGRAYQISSEHHVHNEINAKMPLTGAFTPCRPKKNGAKAACACRLKLIRPGTSHSRISTATALFIRFNRFRGR